MLKKIFAVFLSFFILNVYSTQGQKYSKIDNFASQSFKEIDIPSLVKKLTSNYNTKSEKYRSLYVWVAKNIKYDLDEEVPEGLIVERVWKTKKGVCMHYAMLLDSMAKLAGIKSFYVRGYIKNIEGQIEAVPHAWNAVVIENQTYLSDVTWSSGYFQDGRYHQNFNDYFFMQTPQLFIQYHMPFDPMYQFLSSPLKHKEFQYPKLDSVRLKDDIGYQYLDTIALHQHLDQVKKAKEEYRRCNEADVESEVYNKHIKFLEDNIGFVQMDLVIDGLNICVDKINHLIKISNDKKLGEKINLGSKIDDCKSSIDVTNEMLDQIHTNNDILLADISKYKKQIMLLRDNLKTIDNHLKK